MNYFEITLQVQNVVQNAIAGMGDVGRNARISTRPAPDGSSVDVHIHLGQIPRPQVRAVSFEIVEGVGL